MTAVKGLPLAYNKDLQEDTEAVFDALDTVNLCLDVLPPMLETATFFPERMRAARRRGLFDATDCADYLVTKGVPFRDAYAVSGQLVRLCVSAAKRWTRCPSKNTKKIHPAFGEGRLSLHRPEQLRLQAQGSTAAPRPRPCRAQIENARKALA